MDFNGILRHNLRRLESLSIHTVHTPSTHRPQCPHHTQHGCAPRCAGFLVTRFSHTPYTSLNFIGISLCDLRRLEKRVSTNSTSHPAPPCAPVCRTFGFKGSAMHNNIFGILLEFYYIIYAIWRALTTSRVVPLLGWPFLIARFLLCATR